MKRLAFVLLAGIMVLANCSFLSNFQVMSPEHSYVPFRIDNLPDDPPLVPAGPFIEDTYKGKEEAYIVTCGYIKLHKHLWKKAYPEKKDAEGTTIGRLMYDKPDYKAQVNGQDLIFPEAWVVKAELVNFVESVREK